MFNKCFQKKKEKKNNKKQFIRFIQNTIFENKNKLYIYIPIPI